MSLFDSLDFRSRLLISSLQYRINLSETGKGRELRALFLADCRKLALSNPDDAVTNPSSIALFGIGEFADAVSSLVITWIKTDRYVTAMFFREKGCIPQDLEKLSEANRVVVDMGKAADAAINSLIDHYAKGEFISDPEPIGALKTCFGEVADPVTTQGDRQGASGDLINVRGMTTESHSSSCGTQCTLGSK